MGCMVYLPIHEKPLKIQPFMDRYIYQSHGPSRGKVKPGIYWGKNVVDGGVDTGVGLTTLVWENVGKLA